MQVRRVGHSGLRVSRLGLGTMTWGDDVDEVAAHELLRTFLDAGGTLVDTAPLYGSGASEQVLGSLLAKESWRDRVVLSSKAGLRLVPDGARRDASRGSLLDQLDASLAALGTDHLDLWQVQVWDDGTPHDETFAALEHAVTSGRARYVGISNFTGWQTGLAAAWWDARPSGAAFVSTQVEYSLLRRDAEDDVVPAALHTGLGLLAWSPLGRGVLTGKYRTGIPADSRAASRSLDRFVEPYLTGTRAGVVEAVVRAAEGLDVTPAHVALAWLRDRPAVSSLLIGARTADQLGETLASEDVDVPPEILQALDDVSATVG